MLVNAVIYTFSADDADRAEAILRELRDAARQEPGCLRFDVARGNSDPTRFALYEVYADQAALDAHFATEHFQRLAVNGVRQLAKERVGHLCHPID